MSFVGCRAATGRDGIAPLKSHETAESSGLRRLRPVRATVPKGSTVPVRASSPTLYGLVISTNQFKNGNHVEVDGTIFKILEFQHVKPGKGGAFVRTKLKRVRDGNVIDRTFRAGEKF